MFIPTITGRYDLDALLAPFIARRCGGVMSSVPELLIAPAHWPPGVPRWIDSGGYAALNPGNTVHETDGVGALHLKRAAQVTHILTPQRVHEVQAAAGASVTFSLDFPTPSGMDDDERERRARLSLANARYAATQPRQGTLYLCAQPGQDLAPLLELRPDGLALGGLAPFSSDRERLREAVRSARSQSDLPLHVFGIGHPDSIRAVMDAGANSTDSSSAQRTATAGRGWDGQRTEHPSAAERLHLAAINLDLATRAGETRADTCVSVLKESA